MVHRTNNLRRWAALALVLALLAGLIGCGAEETDSAVSDAQESAAPGGVVPAEPEVAAEELPQSVTIVTDGLTGSYDPRYAQEAGDLAVARLTGASLLSVDTGGGFVYNAASSGMTVAPADVSVSVNGSEAVYTIRLRDELDYTASQLEQLYLALLDAEYQGPRTVAEAPIAGLEAYQSGISDADRTSFGTEFDNSRDETLYAQSLQEAWYDALEALRDECVQAARSQSVDTFGISYSDTGMQVALAMALRGFGEIDSTGVMTGLATGTVWTLSGDDMPDLDDFYAECYACYLGDAAAFAETELGDANALDDAARELYIAARAAESGTGVASVSGIVVTDEKTLTVTVESGDLRYVYNICDVILPDVGPYTLAGESGGSVTLQANAGYFGGTPGITTLTLTGEGTGDISVAEGGSGSYSVWQADQSFGYIGLNAELVSVGADAYSAQSKALRQALCALLSVFRERTISTCYGDAATVLNVPTAADSWTAPEAWTYPADSEAAMTEAKTLLLTAGYTWDDAQGIFTQAPDGASLSYTILIPSGGHPAYTLAKQAAALFGELGLELTVQEVSAETFWQRLAAGQAALWAAAWEDGADTDPSRWTTLCGLPKDYSSLCQTALTSGTASAYQAAYAALWDYQVVLPFYQQRSAVWFSDAFSVLPDRLTGDYDWVRWLTDLALNGT